LLLERLQLALGGEEIAGDFVFKQRVPGTFELANFHGSQLHASVLFMMQLLAPLVDALVLEAGGVVGQETLDVGLKLDERGIAGDLSAKFLGFRNHGRIFSKN
jgi:hypothetical protein